MFESSKLTDARDKETREIQRLVFYAFVLNLALAALKAGLAAFSGSLAVAASAIDSLTDTFASIAVYAGVKLSTRQFKNFPQGLYKIENVISVIIAFFIFFMGYEIARHILFAPEARSPDITPMVVILLALSAIATFMFGRYALQRGRKTGSPTLIAEGHHRQSDVFSSLVVLLSASLTYFGIDFRLFGMGIDHIAAGVILVFIAVAGWRLLMDGMRVLLDASVDQETLEAVREIISQEPAVVGIRSIVGRSSGRFRFIQAAITLRTDDLKRAHDISSRIEQAIHDQVPHVGRIMIHYEPETEPQRRLAVPMDDTRDTICDHFGAAPYFVIFTIDRNARQILGKSFEKNPHRERTHAKGIRVAEWLVQHHHIDAIYLRTDIRHKGPGYVFANAGVQMQLLDTGDLNEVSEAFFETPVKYEPAADRKFEG